MPDHKPPPPATLVDTLPDDVQVPHEDARPAKVAKHNAWTPTGGFLVLTQNDWPTVIHHA